MAAKPNVAQVQVGLDLANLGNYSGGAFIPDGPYIVYHNVMMYAGKEGNQKKANLGVMVDFYPKDNPVEEAKLQKFYSMGSKADESFAPNADTGKGVVPIPGAKGGSLNDKTNWFMYISSLINSGFPQGVPLNDLSVIDGTWVQIANVDEPADRKGFKSATAEGQVQQSQTPQKVPVITEILEGGSPWEGGGGLEAPAPVKATARGAAGVAAVQPKATAKPAAKPAPAPAAGTDTEDIKMAALDNATSIILSKPLGCTLSFLRTGTFKGVKEKVSEEMAGSVISEFFENQENLAILLEEMGYHLEGSMVKPN